MAKDNLESATNQLDLILSFFPRVDAKLSVVLGIDLGMLSILLTKAPSNFDQVTDRDWIGLSLFAAAMMLSLFFLYFGSFPHLNGGTSSLVYFREIAKKKKTEDYARAFNALTEQSLTDDLLSQVWCNAVILDKKFSRLKCAYIATVLGIGPWAFCLYECVRIASPARH
jgi:hypothetical protein